MGNKAMGRYKLYNKSGEIIAYNFDNTLSLNKYELFASDCEQLRLKLSALGILGTPEAPCYYTAVIKNYDIREISLEFEYPTFNNYRQKWDYKPTSIAKWFTGCKDLSKIGFNILDTSSVESMNSTFFGTYNYKKLDLSAWYTPRLKSMGRTFSHAKVKELDISNFDFSNVTTFSGTFDCFIANKIKISNFNSVKAVTMNQMFAFCKLRTLDFSTFNTSKVENMSSMFYENEIPILDLRSFDTAQVKDMSEMFYNCRARSIDLSSFIIRDDCNCEDMFDNCISKITINTEAYNKLKNITTIGDLETTIVKFQGRR